MISPFSFDNISESYLEIILYLRGFNDRVKTQQLFHEVWDQLRKWDHQVMAGLRNTTVKHL